MFHDEFYNLKIKDMKFAVAALLGLATVNAAHLRVKKLPDNDWNDVYWEQDYEDLHLDLRAKSFTISGLSSGGFTTANILAMFN